MSKIVNKIDSTFDDGVVHYYEVSSSTCEAILTDLLEYTQDTASERTKDVLTCMITLYVILILHVYELAL